MRMASTKIPQPLNQLPLMKQFNNLNIGTKHNIGFGLLVLLTLLVVGLIFVASRRATQNINLTENVRVPTTLASTQAQASLLQMKATVRGYLILGDLKNLDEYNKAKEIFTRNLSLLETLSIHWDDPQDIQDLQELQIMLDEWSPIAEQLFLLHDNPQENQPALKLENDAFNPLKTNLIQTLNQVIEIQEQSPLTLNSQASLADLNNLKTSFELLSTHVHGYAISSDLTFRYGYATNLQTNRLIWERLTTNISTFTSEQQELFSVITQARQELLQLSLDIFALAESEQANADLYLFKTKVEPKTEQMLLLLDDMTQRQQRSLQTDLNLGRQSLSNVRIQTVWSGILALILGINMALLFKTNLTKPVYRLIQTAEEITNGDLNARAEIESKDEIGRLATTINIMTDRLQENIDNLAQARDLAEIASRAKSDFLTNMSHELRTPLNGILGYAQILKRDGHLNETQQHAVKIIRVSGEHLLTLINDVLDLAKIEANKLELYPADFEFPRFLEGIVGMFNIGVQQKEGITFTYTTHTSLPIILHADEKRLRQILINLVSNAIKFTNKGHVSFEIHVASSGELLDKRPFVVRDITFTVIDTGIGMSPNQLDKIFLPFQQVSGSDYRREGAGLGLSISKNLVEAMNGTLSVESTLGEGSTFTLCLRLPMLLSSLETQTQAPLPTNLSISSSAIKQQESFIYPPSQEKLLQLHDLALKGAIRRLRRQVDQIDASDTRYQPFTNKLRQFINNYDEDKILEMIESYIIV